MTVSSLKQKLGCWAHERWRTELVLRFAQLPRACRLTWVDLCNRHERLRVEPATEGRICEWHGSSPLTVARLFPEVGARILRHCLADCPIEFNHSSHPVASDTPQISVLIPTAGSTRLPQLKLTLASLRAQRDVSFEIVIVEQGLWPLAQGHIPPDVRYIFAQSDSDQEFNKSWALNIAARAARGKCLAIHDGDCVVPTRYLATCVTVLESFDGVRPARFIAYLDAETSSRWNSVGICAGEFGIQSIVANTPNPVALRRDAYWTVGGHDESFFGWGGEDEEFLSRVRTLRLSEGGLLPVVHLWHPPAPKKASGDRNSRLYASLLSAPAQKRIERLTALPLGGNLPQRSFESCAESEG